MNNNNNSAEDSRAVAGGAGSVESGNAGAVAGAGVHVAGVGVRAAGGVESGNASAVAGAGVRGVGGGAGDAAGGGGVRGTESGNVSDAAGGGAAGGDVRAAGASDNVGVAAGGGARFAFAKAIGSVATFGLQKVLHKNGKNTPGKLALYADPALIEHLSYKVRRSIITVGTNGKTTVNNLIADVLTAQGCSVVCNRDGANLDSGISTALLQSRATRNNPADWGVFESDELWLIKSLPYLQSDYVLLLNLFRDQLDRCGEIEHIQDVIAASLEKSPRTTLIYNGDDPLCALVARKVSNPSLAFGVNVDMHLPQNTVADAQMCQCCEGIMQYAWRQYGQLGAYACPNCGFARPDIDFPVISVCLGGPAEASEVAEGAKDGGVEGGGASFEIDVAGESFASEHAAGSYVSGECAAGQSWHIKAPVSAAYMIYNLAGVCAVAKLAGCSEESTQSAISSFAPNNGRLQKMMVRGHNTLLNLAKNPTGFNQNLKLVVNGARNAQERAENLQNAQGIEVQSAQKSAFEQGQRCTCAVAFFINDKEADGHDVSWLWDVDFEELASVEGIQVFAGGTRAGDMQVRLKYAGIRASIISDAEELFDNLRARGLSGKAGGMSSGRSGGKSGVNPSGKSGDGANGKSGGRMDDMTGGQMRDKPDVYFIANYTSLPQVKASLEHMEDRAPSVMKSDSPKPRKRTHHKPVQRVASRSTGQNAQSPAARTTRKPAQHLTLQPPRHSGQFSYPMPTTRQNAQSVIENAPNSNTSNASNTLNAPAVVIAHIFPDLLNLYGDAGNVSVLSRRLEWRGIPVEVRPIPHGSNIDLQDVDIVFLGGGPDREQRMASAALMAAKDEMHAFAQAGGVILGICGGYQIMGNTWLCGDDQMPGLGLLNIETKRAPGGSTNRLIGNVALTCSFATHPVVGFENHAGRTYLSAGTQPFGRVMGHAGFGNNDSGEQRADGAIDKNVIGTYLHGPLLSKNPEVADYILQLACEHCAQRHNLQQLPFTGIDALGHLIALDDSEEFAANASISARLHL